MFPHLFFVILTAASAVTPSVRVALFAVPVSIRASRCQLEPGSQPEAPPMCKPQPQSSESFLKRGRCAEITGGWGNRKPSPSLGTPVFGLNTLSPGSHRRRTGDESRRLQHSNGANVGRPSSQHTMGSEGRKWSRHP
ncbi:hypothetical protein NHX12_022179 [Muraenolepis orangiensis]|uniref:Secreted protein n=1 Tax=Muraenolepis orangiensis TaxID=630683 RepID=A0A9Q0ER35_9TELE|nr:hypothetical protein NHX12_022179 [Muraenolepis orangiensis]